MRLKKQNPQSQEPTQSGHEKQNQSTCPDCNGEIRNDSEHGEKICEDCGLVVEEEQIDHGPEWREFNSNDKEEKRRVGAPTTKTRHDNGLTTNIDSSNRDGYGNQLDPKKAKKMQRLRRWNKQAKTRDSKERNLRNALTEINRMASALGIPKDVREIASMIYRQCLNQELLPGRSIEGVATAALYAAARRGDVPRSIDEMTQVSKVDRLEISRTYTYINREIGLELGPVDPIKYIHRHIAELDLSQETERLATHITKQFKEEGLHSGRSPIGVAAGAIYFAGKLNNETPTQSNLANSTGVSEVTIRSVYQDIINHGSEEWLFQY